ncbi:MAG: hypothetical protein QW270_00425 [Candidatus Bathyarchaeia archaeon]
MMDEKKKPDYKPEIKISESQPIPEPYDVYISGETWKRRGK